ncbi:MAG TPA: bifunctional DNA primase/polymerase [Pseudonocardia sp.]|uniref:bifunctional DNA primase/polymerase n=1 Tax=Pseudonocardia sp. TaxID=60912 RepID=UPI002C1C1FFD|nr:bifunctional DNA primase/polymerase [Pseudonocardia sp.]HTF53673.1 bifunctional DNA primase/polymerase [Pseudonocardia sp.]
MSKGFHSLDAVCVAAYARGDMTEGERLEAVLDQLDDILADDEGVTAARANIAGVSAWYASRGMPVFPLSANSKVPMKGTHGLLDATVDPAIARRMIPDGYRANLAVATGHTHDVIDVDGPEGHHSVIRQLKADPDFPRVFGIGLTPRGMHFWVAPTGRGNTTAMLPSVDYRGMGGYVVVPPSVVDDSPYRWLMPPGTTA